MAEPTKLTPREDILRGIFPNVREHVLRNEAVCTIISNTFDTCTARIQLPEPPLSHTSQKDVMVRLEKMGGNLPAVAEMQNLAHKGIPNLVLETLAVGTVTGSDGVQLAYSVTPFLSDTQTLEDVWGSLKPDNRESLMDALVVAISTLHGMDISTSPIRPMTSTADIALGGPHLRYHTSIVDFLAAFRGQGAKAKSSCDITATEDGGVLVHPVDREIEPCTLTGDHVKALAKSIVLCHNDLEPRNLLVRNTEPDADQVWYELAAIIDWEMAGFFPFAFEFGVKDTLLGSSNLYVGWYSLFKQKAAHLLPGGEASDKLITTLMVIDRSKQKKMARNVGFRMKAKWIDREQLVISMSNVRAGWVRADGTDGAAQECTKEGNAELELAVLRELGHI